MEKIYTRDQQHCELAKTSAETIRFLLDFSKSLQVTEFKSYKFETFLN